MRVGNRGFNQVFATLTFVFLTTLLSNPIATATDGQTYNQTNLQAAVQSLESGSGQSWHYAPDPTGRYARSADGRFNTGQVLGDEAKVVQVAKDFLVDFHDLFLVEVATLEIKRVIFNPVFHRVRAEFQQTVKGVPVEYAIVEMSFSEDGTLLSVRNGYQPFLSVGTTPSLTEDRALAIARNHLGAMTTEERPRIELVVFPAASEPNRKYFLAWKVVTPEHLVVIDAIDGSIIESRRDEKTDTIYDGKIQGTTYPLTNPGGATGLTPLEYLFVWIDEVAPDDTNFDDETDAQGDYIVVHPTANDTFYTRLESQKVRVMNAQGAEIDTTHLCTPHHDYDLPDSPGHQANVYYNLIKAWNEFETRFGHEQPFVTALANDNTVQGWGASNSIRVRYKPEIGRYSWTLQHELTHAVVFNVNGGWINTTDDRNWDCMDEAFPVYFPCSFNGDPTYRIPGDAFDLSTNVGDMTIRDLNLNGMLDEEDHHYYYNRYAVAAAWWELRGTIGVAPLQSLLWAALVGLGPPNTERRPRDYFNRLLLADDNDGDPANGTPRVDQLDAAYRNHGMNYWPKCTGIDIAGIETNLFFIGEMIYCKGSGLPTNETVRIYIVENNDSWTNGAALNDVSGDVETVNTDANGNFNAIEIWETEPGDAKRYDIIIDVDENGLFDFDFDGIIDGKEDIFVLYEDLTGEIYMSASANEQVRTIYGVMPFEPFNFFVVADVNPWLAGWEASVEFEDPNALIVMARNLRPGSLNIGEGDDNFLVGFPDCPFTPLAVVEYTAMLLNPVTDYLITLAPAIPSSFPDTPTPVWADCNAYLRPFEESWSSNKLIINPTLAGMEETSTVPAAYALQPAFPNPFNPVTTIRYDLPEPCRVTLQVYDLSGRLIRMLRQGSMEEAGHREVVWNGTDGQGRAVSSGVYFYRLTAGPYTETRRMVLVR